MDGPDHPPPITLEYFLFSKACQYTTASSMVLILYDTLITIGQEVELIWHSPWSIPKIVYFANRYCAVLFALVYMSAMLGTNPSVSGCQAVYELQAWYSWTSTAIVQLTVQIWLYAICNRNRRLSVWLGALYITFLISTCITLSISMSRLHVLTISPFCSASIETDWATTSRMGLRAVPVYLITTMIPWVVFTVVLMLLLVHKVFTTFREPVSMTARSSDLAAVLTRDSVIYCLVVLVASVMNVLIEMLAPEELASVGIGFGLALPSIFSSRVLLNLRHVDRAREHRIDVRGVALEQWDTMFHIS